jgi:gas vesicle structural protein
MPVERAAGGTSLVDVLDRVLDKGIVIDAWVRVSLVGIDLITVEARVVVASIDTYLKYAEAVGQVSTASRPALEPAVVSETITTKEVVDRLPRNAAVGAPRRKRVVVAETFAPSRNVLERVPRKTRAGAPRRKRPV